MPSAFPETALPKEVLILGFSIPSPCEHPPTSCRSLSARSQKKSEKCLLGPGGPGAPKSLEKETNEKSGKSLERVRKVWKKKSLTFCAPGAVPKDFFLRPFWISGLEGPKDSCSSSGGSQPSHSSCAKNGHSVATHGGGG